MLCSWTTYKGGGNHCKKLVSDFETDKQSIRFCNLHRELICEYSKIEEDSNELCETYKDIKIVPRSYKHLRAVMSSFGNEDDIVEVYSSGCNEEANISNSDYIVLNSDNSKFYYNPKRGQNKAKDLKVLLRAYCQNNCVVNFKQTKYCEECYKKIKDAPRISIVS